jgi:SAM-dependent methyltransferase
MQIYPRVLRTLINRGWLTSEHSILVLAGGNLDRQSIMAAQLANVTISNLEYHAGHTEYAPFEWRRLDAEKIDLPDNSYDWVVIHAGLHHLAVPAAGVCEMFRVARKGILCFEARDSLLMKLAVKVGLTSEHELEAALLTGGMIGGYRNGPIPNYVYRWTEREFEKVINSYAPTHVHTFFYYYGFQVPVQRFSMARSALYRTMGVVLLRLGRLAEILIPTQGNQFAFGALKDTRLQPWLTKDLQFDASFLSKKYDQAKYPKAR